MLSFEQQRQACYFPIALEGANSKSISMLLRRQHENVLRHLDYRPEYFPLQESHLDHLTPRGRRSTLTTYTMSKRHWLMYMLTTKCIFTDTIVMQLLEGCSLDEIVLPTDKVISDAEEP